MADHRSTSEPARGALQRADRRDEEAMFDHPSWLDRRASNAKLIAEARARIAKGTRAVVSGEQLVRQSAKLMPRSAFDPPTRPPRLLKRLDEAWPEQVRYEQTRVRELREIGYSLLSYAEEMVVASQEIRWQARQTRMRAQAQRERSLRLRRTMSLTPPATLP